MPSATSAASRAINHATPRSPTSSASCTVASQGQTPHDTVQGIIVDTKVPAYTPMAKATGGGTLSRGSQLVATGTMSQRVASNAASTRSAIGPTKGGSDANRVTTA